MVTVLYAATDELHQGFVGGRHASVVDVGIDAIGASWPSWSCRISGRDTRGGRRPIPPASIRNMHRRPSGGQPSGRVSPPEACPYLGLRDDPRTRFVRLPIRRTGATSRQARPGGHIDQARLLLDGEPSRLRAVPSQRGLRRPGRWDRAQETARGPAMRRSGRRDRRPGAW